MPALSLLALLAAVQPPPIVSVGLSQPRIAEFRPGPVRCGRTIVRPIRAEPPLPAGVGYMPAGGPAPVRLSFRVDAEGRPLGIRRVGPAQTAPVDSRDLMPALAAWRFPAGAEHRDCEVTFEIATAPVEQAPLPLLHRYLALSRPNVPGFNAGVGRAAFERAKPAGSTCFGPSPAVRQRVYPAFEEVAQPPGTSSYAFLQFDIDARGRPVGVHVASSSGNAELDRRSIEAVERSRFAPQARRGCQYSYFRRSTEVLAAPAVPALSAYRPEESNCPHREDTPWAHLPTLTFPPEFNRRNVEGWAILIYDLAPWGAVGNVQVVAAEPAEAFGAQAARILSGARARPSEHGYRGCVTSVRFRVPGDGEEARPAD